MKVMIGIPCMEMVHTDFMQSLVGLVKPCEVTYAISKSSLVYDSRNKICEMALNNGYDVILWLDSDMTFDSDVLEKMLKHYEDGYKYVSGIAFARRYPTVPCVYKDLNIDRENKDIIGVHAVQFDEWPDEMFEIEGSGLACCMTSVDMIKDIAIKHGPPFYPRYGFGEDLTFCHMARQEGYKLYCDPSIKPGHIGNIVFNETSWKSQKERKK